MKKVILTKGLPASGKTTWAKKLVSEHPNTYKRINKDDLRAMLDAGGHSKDMEKFILQVRDNLILQSLEKGYHVIVDDTNLAPKHEAHIRELVKGKAEVSIQDFTHIPYNECIDRDIKRANGVGAAVIMYMYNTYLKPKPELYIQDRTLPHAIIVDMDGTLAKMNGRSPFDWGSVGEDLVNVPVKDIVNRYQGKVIIMSGRDSVCMGLTRDWLIKHGISFDKLLMRPTGSGVKDAIIKEELFDEHIRGKYCIDFILDDRQQVVDLWRSMGLTCLQVAEGNF